MNRVDIPGIAVITLAQDHFNPNTDYIEINPTTGECEALWADYYKEPVEPIDHDLPPYYLGEINVSGNPEIKVGGSYKKFTVIFYDRNPLPPGTWSFWIDNQSVDDIIISTTGLEANQIKVKLPNNGLYINKVMTVKYTINRTLEEIQTDVSVVSL